jgi:vanillate O-demethylase monooxygenase subunit
MFVRNHWYVAGFTHEIGQNPLARRICDETIVLYRKTDGSVAAMHDACPHRLAPLSLGLVEGDNIRCKYHGIVFDSAGQCVEMPSQDGVLKNLCVSRIYSVVERYGFVWVWIGDAQKADPDDLPDLWWLEDPKWEFAPNSYVLNCDYRLILDNLMDLTHEAFVHPTTIGQSEILGAPIKSHMSNDKAYLERWMHDIEPSPFWARALGKTCKVDRWQICEFSLPSLIIIHAGVAPVGKWVPEGDHGGVNGIVINMVTPETETSARYYVGMVRDFHIDPVLAVKQLDQVIGEDTEVLEAQQRAMDEMPDARLRVLNIDAGGAFARRMIDAALEEQKTPA